jgi:uncharacterized protein (TIGR02246 family)
MEQSTTSDEAEIRKMMAGWSSAVRRKDAAAATADYSEDLLLFDLPPPLAYPGLKAYRDGLESWFSSFVGPVGTEMHEINVTAGRSAAFATCLNHITGKRTNGEDTDVWVRVTVCFRKHDDRWRVAHEHVSVPFYMDGSYRAAVDLKP